MNDCDVEKQAAPIKKSKFKNFLTALMSVKIELLICNIFFCISNIIFFIVSITSYINNENAFVTTIINAVITPISLIFGIKFSEKLNCKTLLYCIPIAFVILFSGFNLIYKDSYGDAGATRNIVEYNLLQTNLSTEQSINFTVPTLKPQMNESQRTKEANSLTSPSGLDVSETSSIESSSEHTQTNKPQNGFANAIIYNSGGEAKVIKNDHIFCSDEKITVDNDKERKKLGINASMQ